MPWPAANISAGDVRGSRLCWQLLCICLSFHLVVVLYMLYANITADDVIGSPLCWQVQSQQEKTGVIFLI